MNGSSMWVVGTKYGVSINRIDNVTGTTAKTYTFTDKQGRVQRNFFVTEFESSFPTWEQAQAFIIERLNRDIERAQREIARAQADIARVNGYTPNQEVRW